MPETTFYTTFSTSHFSLSRAKNGSESGLRSAVSYRFGFNGQEMDNEISGQTGTHTTAMFWEYDSRLGRRWNLDPVVKYSQSGYACFSNSPIVLIDPNGDDDYYNKKGEKIGTDGTVGDVYIVTDRKVARDMAKQFKKSHVMNESEKSSMSNTSFKLPSYCIRQAIKLSETNSNSDKMHEEGGFAGYDRKGTEQIIEGTPGKSINPFDAGDAYAVHCDPLVPKNKSDRGKLEGSQIMYYWHIHPAMGALSKNGEEWNGFKQSPSSQDFTSYDINIEGGVISKEAFGIVVGAATPTFSRSNPGRQVNDGAGDVMFYKGKNVVFRMNKDVFYKIPESDGKGYSK